MRAGWDIGAFLAEAPLGEAPGAGAAGLVERVVRHLAAAAGGAAFAAPTDDGRHLLLTSAGPAGAEARAVFPLAEPFPAARAIRTGEPLWLTEPESAAAPLPGPGGPVACLPVPAGAGVGGALLLRLAPPGDLDEADRAALLGLAREVGKALEHARLVEAALTARTRLVVLAEASARLLQAGPERSALLAAAARAASEALGDPCLLALSPAEGERGPWLRLHHPEPRAHAALGASAEVGRALADALQAEVRASGDTVFRAVLDPGALAAGAPAAAAWLSRHPVHALLAAPLRLGGEPFGVLAVLRHRPHAPYSSDDRLLLEGLADRVALSVAYERLAASERAAARRQEQLAAAARAFSEAQGDPAEIRRIVARRGAIALAARCSLWSPAPGADPALLAACPPRPAGRALAAERAAAVEAMGTGRPAAREAALQEDAAGRFAVAAPVRVNGKVEGALAASRRAGHRTFEPADQALLADLAVHAGLALEHAAKRAALEAERQRLSEVLASAEGASRAKDEFIAMLSHELRNPLSPIVTALELMRLHDPAAVRRERVVIERQVAHLVRLVDDLLDVSRVMRGKVHLERRSVPLADLVARAIEQASPLLEERRHTLRVEAGEGLELVGDPHRLAQVVANLLTNAAKYTDPGGQVALEASVEGPELRLSVTDNGIGISPALLPRVFDLFVQGERTLDRAPGGLGIGLTIVRSLVELHGGRVAVESAGRGRGSTFTVWLPRGDPARAARALPAPVDGRPAGPGSPVLVVDDNEDAAELLADVLRARGHEVRVAFDGPGALVAAEGAPPRVALLDLGLPVMDGYELARRLRARIGGLRLVAVTGYGQEVDRRASALAGFDAHLVKPVDLDEICAVVERLAPAGSAAAGAEAAAG